MVEERLAIALRSPVTFTQESPQPYLVMAIVVLRHIFMSSGTATETPESHILITKEKHNDITYT